jgi:hypothetical protein
MTMRSCPARDLVCERSSTVVTGSRPRTRKPSFSPVAWVACLLAVGANWIYGWFAAQREHEWLFVPLGILGTPFALALGLMVATAIHAPRVWLWYRRPTSTEPSAVLRAAALRGRDAAMAAALSAGLLALSTGVARSQVGAPIWAPALFGAVVVLGFCLGAWFLHHGARSFSIGLTFGVGASIAGILALWLARLAVFNRWRARVGHTGLADTLAYVEHTIGYSGFIALVSLLNASVVLCVNTWRLGLPAPSGMASVRHGRRDWVTGALVALAVAIVLVPRFSQEDVRLRTEWPALTVRQSSSDRAAFRSAVLGLRRMVACVRDANPLASGSAAVSVATSGTGAAATSEQQCLDDAVKAGSVPGAWTLRYALSTSVTDPTGFWALAESDDPRERIVYVDAAGVMYAMWRTGRADSLLSASRAARTSALERAHVPPPAGSLLVPFNSPLHQLALLRRCVASLQYSVRDTLDVCQSLRAREDGTRAVELRVQSVDHPEIDARYEAVVQASPAGNRRTFVIWARPVVYGVDGFRSFFLDESGTMHTTSGDRHARGDDPLVPACETLGINCYWDGFRISEGPAR